MGTRNVASLTRNCFAQCPHQNIDLFETIEVLFNSPPVSPEHTQAVSLVDQEDDVRMRVPQPDQLSKRRDVPIHAVDGIDHDQLVRVIRQLAEFAGQITHVVVSELHDLGSGKAASIGDARVIELIGKHIVTLAN